MSYRDELIQVAAVAVAAVHNLDTGSTLRYDKDLGYDKDRSILDEVLQERLRQEAKWGAQSHAPERWLAILTEEVGEVARAILEGDGA
jgi:hypothetical protein